MKPKSFQKFRSGEKVKISGKARGLHAKKKRVITVAASALAVAVTVGGVQLVSTASAAEDCVSGAAAAYSTRPICKNTPPSQAEEVAQRAVGAVISLGLSEAIENATVSTHLPEGCIEPAAVKYDASGRPICKSRSLTPAEKALASAGLGLLGTPSATAALPSALQRLVDAGLTAGDVAGAAKALSES
ncbi:hypothetical protein [Streptomyces sp. NPDC006459]|uniref:hypothetical protein n=1 Tax=Streptomyces sp. NPDC006459 TaxID=3154303 RepID=UPI0033B0C4E7